MHILNEITEKIFVITLERFKTRVEEIKERLKDLDYEIFYGTDGFLLPDDIFSKYGKNRTDYFQHVFGCALSHMAIHKKIIDDNLNNVLILEDDNFLINENTTGLEIIKTLKNLPKDYDLIHFGLLNAHQNYEYLPRNYSECLFKLNNGSLFLEGGSAYLISNNFVHKIYEHQIKYMDTIDGAFMKLFNNDKSLNYYVTLPQIFIQDFKLTHD